VPEHAVGDLRFGRRLNLRRFAVFPQPSEVVAEGLVKGDNVAAGGVAPGRVLAAHCGVDAFDDHLVEHDAVADQHRLDRVARLKGVDQFGGGPGAGEAPFVGFAGAVGNGFGDAGDEVGDEVELVVHNAGALLRVDG